MARETIKLYGNIFDWTANSAIRMVAKLSEAAKVADGIDLHVHCYGGAIAEGNMIYNAIRKCPVPVDVYVDGVAASMAAIIMQAASTRKASENAFIMLHAPEGYCSGRQTADAHTREARVLREMEKTFVKTIVGRTGKPESEVKEWLSGADMWFSAEQALEAGLIDEIVDPVAGQVEKLKPEELENYTQESIYGLYAAYLCSDEKTKTNTQNMDKQALIDQFGLTGVTADSPDEKIQAAIQAKLDNAAAGQAAAEAALKKEQSAQIATMLDGVKGKITPEQRAQFQAVGDSMGLDALKAIVEPLKVTKSLSEMLRGGVGMKSQAEDRSGWSFKEWAEKDAAGLEAMETIDPDAFNALYKAQYGKPAPKQ